MHSRITLGKHRGFTVPLLALTGLIFVAGCSGNKALLGKWDAASLAGKPFSGRQANPQAALDLQGGGHYKVGPQAGTWSVEGSAINLHPETFKGKTQPEFVADLTTKYKMDAPRLAIVTKIYDDWKLTVSPDQKILSMSPNGILITYEKETEGAATK